MQPLNQILYGTSVSSTENYAEAQITESKELDKTATVLKEVIGNIKRLNSRERPNSRRPNPRKTKALL